MKKKLPVIILSLLCSGACAVGLAACGESEHHTHSYSEDWSSNESSHWHDTTCGHDVKGSEGAHIDADNNGECDVCKYTPMTVKVGGTYYFCENDVTDDSMYITLKDGKWTDDEDLTGDYSITGNTITLYIELDGEKTEFLIGLVSGDDVTLDMGGAPVVYRKGDDIGNKPKEKTLKYSLSVDRTYYIVNGIGGLTGDIEIPDEYKRKPVKEIAENAFASCSDLTSIVIGDNVTTVGKKAFYNCANLTEAVLGESVEGLAESTFESCKKLEKVTISTAVKSFEYDVFKDCSALVDIYYTGTASDWAAIDFKYSIGSYRIDMANPFYATYMSSTGVKELYRKLYIDGELLTSADLTDAETISPVCFYRYKYLESAAIGGTVAEIGEHAFYRCDNLTSVQFGGSSLKAVGKYSFGGSKIDSVTLPNSVERIEEGAFNSCEQLTSANTGSGVTDIGYGAFMGCEGLTTLTLGSSVMEMGEYAFYSCYALESVTIPSSAIYIGKNAFSSTGITSAVFNNTEGWKADTAGGYVEVENLSDAANAAALLKNGLLMQGYADYDWEKPTLQYTLSNDGEYYIVKNNGTVCRSEIVIPETYNGKPVRALDYGAFSNCTSLRSISLPGCMLEIPLEGYYGAFNGCTSLESIEVRGYLVSDYEEVYASIDGVLYNADCTQILFIPSAKTTITISGVTEISEGTFAYNSNIKNVIIADGVTAIGNDAFLYCSNLTSVVIPDSVTSIGEQAFSGCTSLKNVNIPEGVTSIATYAFSDCHSLTDIVIPASITQIGEYAFYYCKGLTSITIPSGVTSIGQNAFHGLGSMTSITIPKSVTSMGSHVFLSCYGLTVYCEASMQPNGWANNWNADYCPVVWNCKSNDQTEDGCVYAVIGGIRYRFEDGSVAVARQPVNITDIVIPTSVMYKGKLYNVSEIDYNAFSNCNNLKSITYAGNIESWCRIRGLGNMTRYGASDKKLFIDGKEIKGDLVIPNGVTEISDSTFYGCSGLTSVVIPDSVTNIGSDVFYGCSGLTSVTIPSSITRIGSNAFYNCDNITRITYTGDVAGWCKVSGLGGLMCYGASDKTLIIDGKEVKGDLVIPDGVTYISYYAFFGCGGLTSVVLPDTVDYINGYAFSGCSGLKSINIPASIPRIDCYTFSGCSSLTNITLPDGIAAIEYNAFERCTSLKSINIPASVEEIDQYAFSGCSSLTSITIPAGVEKINHHAFSGCSSLTSITIPNGVTLVSQRAFADCTSLKSVTIPSSVTEIDEYAFSGCIGLTSLTISAGVTKIGGNAFSGCSNLTNVIIPASVEEIGSYAFSDCIGLANVTISAGVTRISDRAFDGCSSLMSVTIPTSVEYIGHSAFYNCGDLKIYCEAESRPDGWNSNWNHRYDGSYYTVIWDCKNNYKDEYGNAYAEIDGISYKLNGSEATVLEQSSSITSAVIPSTVTYKGDSYTVTRIGQYAFRNCSELKSITIPNSVTMIDYGAFRYCTGLTSVVIPESVEYVGGYLFDGCSNLESVIINGGEIGSHMFSNCEKLTSVTINDTVKYIGGYVFTGCSSLTTITYNGTEGQWNAIGKVDNWDDGLDEGVFVFTGNEE